MPSVRKVIQKIMNTSESLDQFLDVDQSVLKKASRKRRIAAFMIDHVILTCVMVTLTFLILGTDYMEGNREPDPLAMLIAMLPGMLLYFAKDCFRGMSLGKWVRGIVVRDANDFQVTPSVFRLFLRNVFIVISPIEFIVLAASNEKQRIGDQVAKTAVLSNPKKAAKAPRIVVLVVTGILLFCMIILLTSGVLKNSDAYKVAIKHIESDREVISETGGITGYGTIPNGSIEVSNGYGKANFHIDVKGQARDIEVGIYLTKEPDGEWQVVRMEK
jgi:uncharacterized RDD family membrane protein YckC